MKGFTLIEVLVYVALLALLVTASHASFVALADSADRIQAEALLLREGMVVYERVRDDVREGGDVIEADADLLTLTQDGEQMHITRSEGRLYYEVDGRTIALTTPEIRVESFRAVPHQSALNLAYELAAGRSSGVTRRFNYVFYP